MSASMLFSGLLLALSFLGVLLEGLSIFGVVSSVVGVTRASALLASDVRPAFAAACYIAMVLCSHFLLRSQTRLRGTVMAVMFLVGLIGVFAEAIHHSPELADGILAEEAATRRATAHVVARSIVTSNKYFSLAEACFYEESREGETKRQRYTRCDGQRRALNDLLALTPPELNVDKSPKELDKESAEVFQTIAAFHRAFMEPPQYRGDLLKRPTESGSPVKAVWWAWRNATNPLASHFWAQMLLGSLLLLFPLSIELLHPASPSHGRATDRKNSSWWGVFQGKGVNASA